MAYHRTSAKKAADHLRASVAPLVVADSAKAVAIEAEPAFALTRELGHFSATDIVPLLRPRQGDIWEECRRCADAFHNALRVALDSVSVGAEVSTSAGGVYPIVVRCDLWIPVSAADHTRRCCAIVEFAPQPQRELTLRINASCTNGGKLWKGPAHDTTPRGLPAAATVAEELVAFFFAKSQTPPEWFQPSVIAVITNAFISNHWQGLKRRASVGTQLLLAALLIIPWINIVAMIILAVMQFSDGFGHSKGRAVILDSGRPKKNPRQLDNIDSWHVVLPGLASRRDNVIAEVLSTRDGITSHGTEVGVECISHRTLNHLETRQQIVWSLRRAEVFAHVHEYGADLYVAWDAHLNKTFWKEEYVHEGRERGGVRRAIVSIPSPSQAGLTEYDLVDVNLLSEQVHRRLRSIVERLALENRIDQEIDFTPLRRNRSEVLAARGGQASTTGRRARTLGRTA